MDERQEVRPPYSIPRTNAGPSEESSVSSSFPPSTGPSCNSSASFLAADEKPKSYRGEKLKKSRWEPLLDVVFPPTCFLCRNRLFPVERDYYFCALCRERIAPIGWYCLGCQRTQPSYLSMKEICGCGSFAQQPFFGLFWYEGSWKRSILAFKYYQQPHLARILGRMLGEAYLESLACPPGVTEVFPTPHSVQTFPDPGAPRGIVTYMPLHPLREKSRGYNQSYLLAREFSRTLRLPLFSLLKRVKETSPQTSLTRGGRKNNLEGAFAPAVDPVFTKGRGPILLIDDVLTTGATMTEAISTLHRFDSSLFIQGIFTAIHRSYNG